jgi:pimeloyl-ACP methyl ester carboxylesterase
MHDMSAPSGTPEAIVADLERRAARHDTPCGEGALVWRCWGEGPPLLLLHGGNGAWSHWIRNIESLAASRQVWAPDIPGHGDSAPPPRRDNWDSYAEALALGLRQLPIPKGPIDVVAFSLGGLVAAHLAAVAPDLVRRLVVVDTGGLDTPLVAPKVQPLRGLEGEALRERHRENLLAMMIHDPANCDDLAVHIQALNAHRGRIREVRDMVLPDKFMQVLPRVRAPVDLIWAEHDVPHPFPELQLEAVRRLRPQAQMRVISDAGHWVMYENAPAFNAALRDLLDQPLPEA